MQSSAICDSTPHTCGRIQLQLSIPINLKSPAFVLDHLMAASRLKSSLNLLRGNIHIHLSYNNTCAHPLKEALIPMMDFWNNKPKVLNHISSSPQGPSRTSFMYHAIHDFMRWLATQFCRVFVLTSGRLLGASPTARFTSLRLCS